LNWKLLKPRKLMDAVGHNSWSGGLESSTIERIDNGPDEDDKDSRMRRIRTLPDKVGGKEA
jgi:hypothetical protein